MAQPPPQFGEGFPNMPDTWFTNGDFDLGFISGLYETAAKSLGKLLGDYEFHLNEEDLLDFGDLGDFAKDAKGAIIYGAIWAAAAIIFTIVGLIWCCCQKCKCCCKSSFQKEDEEELVNTDPYFQYQLPPRYSERKEKKYGRPGPGAIVVAVLLTIFSLCLVFMVILAFGANQKTKEAAGDIDSDLTFALEDIGTYLDVTINQIIYTFANSYDVLNKNVETITKNCDSPGDACDIMRTKVLEKLGDTNKRVEADIQRLINALEDVRKQSENVNEDLDNDVEDLISAISTALYAFFMIFNVLYLLIFILILVGIIFALFARRISHKMLGHSFMRFAVVLMFILGILVVAQMLIMFFVGMVGGEVICPAIRELEQEPAQRKLIVTQEKLLKQGETTQSYEIPNFGTIIRKCKANRSAYDAFNLVDAFDISLIEDINKEFDDLIGSQATFNRVENTNPSIKADPIDTARQIQVQVKRFTDFVIQAVRDDVGRCEPIYNILDTTINLFCVKLASPVIAYWFVLQFIAVAFLLIIVTVLVYEKIVL